MSPEKDRDIAFQFIIKTRKMNLNNKVKMKNLRQLISQGTLKSLNALEKFIRSALDEGESMLFMNFARILKLLNNIPDSYSPIYSLMYISKYKIHSFT